MTTKLEGNWYKGLAYDIHSLGSSYLGVDEHGHKQWDTNRTKMGELVYQLKSKGKQTCVTKIIDLISARIKGLETYDIIVPIPATKHRAIQPVYELAKELGRRKKIRVVYALKKTLSSDQLKNISDPEKREQALKEAMEIDGDYDFSGKKVLLLDDLYRSGVTLRVATDILYEKTRADKVSVLTMTKTRSNR